MSVSAKLSSLSVASETPFCRFQEALRATEEAAGSLGVEALSEALGEAEKLKARLWVRLYALTVPRQEDADRLLEVDEAARLLSLSPDTLYRRAGQLPFTVRIGGSVRFSALGIQKFIRARQGR